MFITMTQHAVCKLVVRVQRKTVVVGNVITAELHAHVITMTQHVHALLATVLARLS